MSAKVLKLLSGLFCTVERYDTMLSEKTNGFRPHITLIPRLLKSLIQSLDFDIVSFQPSLTPRAVITEIAGAVSI
jgi:hypothetical protein